MFHFHRLIPRQCTPFTITKYFQNTFSTVLFWYRVCLFSLFVYRNSTNSNHILCKQVQCTCELWCVCVSVHVCTLWDAAVQHYSLILHLCMFLCSHVPSAVCSHVHTIPLPLTQPPFHRSLSPFSIESSQQLLTFSRVRPCCLFWLCLHDTGSFYPTLFSKSFNLTSILPILDCF